MSDPVKGVMEDIRKGILLTDFSGGIVTDTGGLSLGANQSPDSLNVFAWEGNLHFRGGYNQFSTLPAGADGAFTYFDRNKNVHLIEWAGGSMYEVTTGAPVLIASGVYTPGQIIAHEQLNGILYWSTLTVPIRQWDTVTEQAVVNGGGTGSVAIPACQFLVAFNGSLIAVNVVVAGVPNPGAFMWSNVNNPSVWIGANTQAVGSNDGGSCVFAILMGVAQVGVTPSKQFMVGKDNRQLFLYAGALGTLTENAISSPVGILQGASAVYIPTAAGLGGVMFLGEDGQFYLTNGIECPIASNNIKILCTNLVNLSLAANPNQRFNAVYNQRFQYYMCDFGNNTQLVYKWDVGGDGKQVGAWWLFQGWPSGVYSSAPLTRGLPSVFVGANYGGVAGVYELALDQTDDNGQDITAYWTSAYIHGGRPERLKIFQEVTLFSYNVGVQYQVTAQGLPQSNQIVPSTKELLFNDPAVGAISPSTGSASLWGVAEWGIGLWSGTESTLTQPYKIGGMKGPLVVPSAISKWGPAGYPLPLRTGAAQFKVAWNGGVPDFRVTSLKIAFLPQNENVGALPFSNQGQVVSNFSADRTTILPGNPFTNTGLPLPNPLPNTAAAVASYPLTFAGYSSFARASQQCLQMSADGSKLYILCVEDDFVTATLLTLDTATGLLTGAVTLGTVTGTSADNDAIYLSSDETRLYYLTHSPNPTLTVFNASTLAVVSTVPISVPLAGVTVLGDLSPDGAHFAIVQYGALADRAVYVVNTATFVVTPGVLVNGAFNQGIAWINNSNFLVASSGGGLDLVEYDTTATALGGLDSGVASPNYFSFTNNPTASAIYGCNFAPNRIFKSNYAGTSTFGAVPAGQSGNSARAVNVLGTAYILEGNKAYVKKFDGSSFSSSPFPDAPDSGTFWVGLAIANGYMYTTNCVGSSPNSLVIQREASF